MKIFLFYFILLVLITLTSAGTTYRIADHDAPPNAKAKLLPNSIPQEEFSSSFWNENAQELVRQKVEAKLNTNRAKNVIMFLGDGMSIPTLAAARIYMGQLEGNLGENTPLSFEQFPVSGLSKTYCVDHQVADSACTATAYLGGVKTNNGIIGVTANVTRGQCDGQQFQENLVESIASLALKAGKEAGIVTTTSITDASPAGAYAHIAERGWESDADLPVGVDRSKCVDIARQLITQEPGSSFKVILGGGRKQFYPPTVSSEGRRLDDLDLVSIWKEDKAQRSAAHSYVTDRDQLKEALDDGSDYLLGLFSENHLDYHLLAKDTQPTLEELTESAIQVLSKSDKGYFLFVEGGRIDHGHHATQARMALDETVEFSKAVAKASSLTDPEDTLIVVTSDHAHVMSLAGYPTRGNDILGANDNELSGDGLPYLTLGYANGNGYRKEVGGERIDVTKEEAFLNNNPEFLYPSMVPKSSESHGGDDVGVFARGPWQHLFSGSYEQNFIAHGMAYAMFG